MLELVARHLRSIERPKMEVTEASDGDEAWRLARDRLPDLVVLDVMMPGMSGWEVCRKIRQDAALAHTGVLMLTGIGESLNEATSPLFGADEYIDKPFDFEQLDEKVIHVLERRAAQREAVPRPAQETDDHVHAPGGNGVGGPAKPATRLAPPLTAKRTTSPAKRRVGEAKSGATKKKGTKKMAAKKGAKKAAKKSAKKAKKTAKKAKKK